METLNELKEKVSKLYWRFAKTMPHCPHWYIVRKNVDENLYIELFNAIEKYGVKEYFYKTPRKYLHLGDGYKYWHCQRFDEYGIVEINDDSVIINRCKETDKYGEYIPE